MQPDLVIMDEGVDRGRAIGRERGRCGRLIGSRATETKWRGGSAYGAAASHKQQQQQQWWHKQRAWQKARASHRPLLSSTPSRALSRVVLCHSNLRGWLDRFPKQSMHVSHRGPHEAAGV